MVTVTLKLVQPITFVAFILAGILCLFIKDWHKALINLSIANANFWLFYGDKVFK